METPPPPLPPAPSLPRAAWVRLSQGLSAIFWSLPLSLCLGATALFAPLREWLPHHEIFLAGSFALAFFGARRMASVTTPGKRWRRRARWAEVAAVAGAYFSLFVEWWRLNPQNFHLVLNVLALCWAGTALMLCLADALAGLAQWMGDEPLAGDFRAAFYMSLFVGAMPLLGVLAALFAATRMQFTAESVGWLTAIGEEFSGLVQSLHRWTTIGLASACLLPTAVLVVGVWRLKARVLRVLGE